MPFTITKAHVSVADIIANLGGPASVGRAIGKSTEHAAALLRRRSVPVRYWPALLAFAKANGSSLTEADLVAANNVRATDDALTKAIACAGGSIALGVALDITPQAIRQWRTCPGSRVIAVARLSGVPCHELRPDLYPANLKDVVATTSLTYLDLYTPDELTAVAA